LFPLASEDNVAGTIAAALNPDLASSLGWHQRKPITQTQRLVELFSSLAVRHARSRTMVRRNQIISLVVAAIIIAGILIGARFLDMGWHTSPLKRAPEQNQGGNAPADTSPAAGVQKNPKENTEMPGQ